VSFYLQGLSDLEEACELVLGDVDLAPVHVLEDGLHIRVADVLEHDDRVGTGDLEEQRLEVGRTGGQHHLVALNGGTFAGQRAVSERFTLQQLVEHGQQVGPVVVPAQAVLLRSAPHLAAAALLPEQANLQSKYNTILKIFSFAIKKSIYK